MFYYLNGTAALLDQNLAVIDCQGVGYGCHVSSSTLARLTVGKPAQLFTYCHIREDAFDIFGFISREEKRCFELLLGVSGVGPKAALSILSVTSPEALIMNIASGNDKALTAAPGVGKKIAQRIVLELKDKLAGEAGQSVSPEGGFAVPTAAGGGGGKRADAEAALAVLGYAPAEISAALKGIDMEALTLEEIVKTALRQMLR